LPQNTAIYRGGLWDHTFPEMPGMIRNLYHTRFEVFTVMKIEVLIFLSSDVVGHQHFRGLCCLHLQGGWYQTTSLHGITTQKIMLWIYHTTICKW